MTFKNKTRAQTQNMHACRERERKKKEQENQEEEPPPRECSDSLNSSLSYTLVRLVVDVGKSGEAGSVGPVVHTSTYALTVQPISFLEQKNMYKALQSSRLCEKKQKKLHNRLQLSVFLCKCCLFANHDPRTKTKDRKVEHTCCVNTQVQMSSCIKTTVSFRPSVIAQYEINQNQVELMDVVGFFILFSQL